jgi:hypothetical protein
VAGQIALELSQTRFVVQPGGIGATATLAIRNASTLVDQLSVHVVGIEPTWVTITPASINLFPGGQAELTLSLTTPSDAPAGSHPFQVVASSQADPSAEVRLEATVEIPEVGLIELAVVPLRQYAFRKANYTLQLGNRGNNNRLVQLVADDADEALRFEFTTDQVLVRPGQEAAVPLRVRPRRRTWRGAEQSLFFTVSALPAQDPLGVPLARGNGELVRRSLLGALLALPVVVRRAALVALPLLLAALIGLFFLGQAGQQLPTGATGAATPTLGPLAAGGNNTPTPATKPGAATPASAPTPAPASTPVVAAVAPPEIAHFGLELPADEAPAFLPLDWDVRGATTTQLTRSPNATGPSRGEADIEAADYTLSAANEGGTTSQTMRVYVLRPPVITEFTASAVQVGDRVVVSWKTDRANTVYLNDQPLDGSEGTLEMAADPNSPYVLRAENVVGQDTRALELTVVPTLPPTEESAPEPTDAPVPTDTPVPAVVVTPRPVEVVGVVVTPSPVIDDEPPVVPTLEPTVVPEVTVTPDVATEVPTVVVPPTVGTVVTPPPVITTIVPGCTTKFQPLNFTATVNGSNVDLKWSTSGGCAPYHGDLKAVYTYNGSDKSYAANTLSGTGNDTPPAGGCGSANQINYTLTLHDTNGLTISASASASLQHDCTNNPPPPPPPGKPAIAGSRTPPPNGAGWNNTDVTVSFTCSDGAPSASISLCGPNSTLTTEGADQSVTGTVNDSLGATASATVNGINIDKTAPTISAVAAPAPNAAGWNNTDVTLTYTCADALSGIATCPTPQTITTEGANQAVTGTATDKAGNNATATTTLSIDKTPATTTATPDRTPNAAGWIGRSAFPAGANTFTVNVALAATDALSGVRSITFSAAPACAGCGGQTIAQQTVNAAAATVPITAQGQTLITFFATDVAGNAEAPKTFTVRLDTTPPTIGVTNVSNATFDGPIGASVTVNSIPSVITLTATDAPALPVGSGIASITFSGTGAQNIGSSTVNAATANITVNTDGTTLLTFSTVDKAGNTATGRFSVTVTRPSINLTISGGGTGTVTITSNQGVITCTATCVARFNFVGVAISVTLSEAATGARSGFAGWSGDIPPTCTASPPAPQPATCTVTLPAANTTLNITASFIIGPA